MQINRIELKNFRNHQHLVLSEIGSVLIIVGDNAVGKTNIIEALQLLSMHESFRKPKPEELKYRYREETQTFIKVDIQSIKGTETKQISFIDNTRAFSYNKKERPAKDLIDLLPAVLFTPDDLQIVKGPPEHRRDILDSLGARLSKTFSQIRSDYYKALRQKNSLLKQEEVDRELLDSWNVHLAKLGTSLSKHRIGLFEQLISTAASTYHKISGGEELEGVYQISWKLPDTREGETMLDMCCESQSSLQEKEFNPQEVNNDLYNALSKKRDQEIAAKRALVGPHKDDICFSIHGHDTRRLASQGQQRSIALALKMAEIEIMRRVSGKNPLLLLDDVMSELDATRRKYFVTLIGKANQTVITTTNLDYFEKDFLSRATIVQLKENTCISLETDL